MGYYEGWDNVWGDNGQILGWICPRCEQFVPMYKEHICRAVESDQPSKCQKRGKKPRHESPIRMS